MPASRRPLWVTAAGPYGTLREQMVRDTSGKDRDRRITDWRQPCAGLDPSSAKTPGYSMISSPRPSNGTGIVMPSALAPLRLMKRPNSVGVWTGSSPGLSPLWTRLSALDVALPTYRSLRDHPP